jgi:hypothetical protein
MKIFQVYPFVVGFLVMIAFVLFHHLLASYVAKINAENRALKAMNKCLYRINEWRDKYPNVSFRRSPYGKKLLHDLYQAARNHASAARLKKINQSVLELIHTLLETDPDDDLPPDIAGPVVGPVFLFLAVWDDVRTFLLIPNIAFQD